MVLQASLQTPTILRQVIEGMKDLVKEVNFDCNESGLQVQCMDSSNVGMVHLMMKESAFDEFHCSEPVTLGLNVEALGKVLRMCGSNDKVVLKAGGDVPAEKLRFEFISPDDDRIADFEMSAMSIEAAPVGVPPLEGSKVIATLPSNDLKKAVTDLKEFGDFLRVTTTKDGIKFNSEGDIGTANVLLKSRTSAKPEECTSIDGTAEIDMSFGMRYINLFTRASSLSKTCEFQFQQGHPFRLTYYLEEESHGFIKFLLAPKVDDNC